MNTDFRWHLRPVLRSVTDTDLQREKPYRSEMKMISCGLWKEQM